MIFAIVKLKEDRSGVHLSDLELKDGSNDYCSEQVKRKVVPGIIVTVKGKKYRCNVHCLA